MRDNSAHPEHAEILLYLFFLFVVIVVCIAFTCKLSTNNNDSKERGVGWGCKRLF